VRGGPLGGVGVAVGGTGVLVGVLVGVGVFVGVFVGVLVGVGVFVGVFVGVGVLVDVFVGVGVLVDVFVGVGVLVGDPHGFVAVLETVTPLLSFTVKLMVGGQPVCILVNSPDDCGPTGSVLEYQNPV
jgi:hypothetical protein